MATSLRKTLIIVTGEEGLFPSDTLYPSDELFPGARIIENIVDGTLKLDEILSESPIQFGQMYATKFEVQVYLEEDLSGKWIQVYQYDGTVYREVFSGKIDSCKLDKIGTDRTIVAYDKAYTFGQINIASWWKTYWTNHETATLKQVRDSMLDNFGIESVKTKALVNDSLVVKKDVAFDSCSLTDMLRMMCEISCCFPHIGRDGILEYITLDPNPTAKDLSELYEWMNSEFEDFETDTITGVQFYDSGDQLKWTVGTATNAYPIQKNVFLYDAGTTTLNTVGNAILNAISSIKYTPSSIKMIQSDFTIKLGDYVETTIGSFYVLENSYSGTQMVEQTLKATGDQRQYDGTPTFDYSDIILNEKIARINYSIEGLETEFTTKMVGLFANYKEDYVPIPNETTSSPANEPAATWISQGTQSDHIDEVFYYKNTTGSYGIYYRWDKVGTNTYRWNQVATSLDAFTVLSSTFKQTAEEISTEVSRATSAEGNLSSRITQNANAITMKVSSSDLVSELNSQLTIANNKIELISDGKIIIHGTNFSVDANGYLTANNATINGQVISTYAGTYGTSKATLGYGYLEMVYENNDSGGIYACEPNIIQETGVSYNQLTIVGSSNRGLLLKSSDDPDEGSVIRLTEYSIDIFRPKIGDSLIGSELNIDVDSVNIEATDFDLSNVTNIILSSTYSGIDTIVAIGSYHYRFVKGILVERY